MRSGRLIVVGILTLVLPPTAAAAPSRPDKTSASRTQNVPFVTLASGGSTRHPRRNRVSLARSLAATKAWGRWLSADARKALDKVDFRRYGVVAAFHLQQSTGLRIRRIARASHTLGLWLDVFSAAPQPTRVTFGAYQLVTIQKTYLRTVSRLAVRSVRVCRVWPCGP
ncbi:MAG TPA: hypothetical protein VLU96_13230 [Gaiellaceae bacterium]|nr:hypothetical protein [Gaiellaceae bacterium]